jgi:hypothetical protein
MKNCRRKDVSGNIEKGSFWYFKLAIIFLKTIIEFI